MRAGFVVLATFVLVIASACGSIPTAGEIPASIATAATAADHLRIADYFAARARDYETEAEFHETMPRSYFGRPRYDFAAMTAHCRELQKQLNAAAREARALEQAHRDLAASIAR